MMLSSREVMERMGFTPVYRTDRYSPISAASRWMRTVPHTREGRRLYVDESVVEDALRARGVTVQRSAVTRWARALRSARAALGDLVHVARQLGVAASTLWHWEQGRRLPTSRAWERAKAALPSLPDPPMIVQFSRPFTVLEMQ